MEAGRRLGPYEILSLIGAGGMGEVYRARDPRLGRDVALKIIHPDRVGRPQRRLRFEREARAAAALNHPSILTVHDVGCDGDTAYIVTELLEGETLRAILSRRSPTCRQILTLALQAARGLAAAHEKGIIHRDLKPENLFVTSDGRLKILDFGLAQVSEAAEGGDSDVTGDRPTRPGVLVGTVAYMSPEQVKALPVDSRSDLFSFGVVLQEALCGRHPFQRESVGATLAAILSETPPLLSSLEPALPTALDGIVGRCLDKDPGERFRTAHDLALALEAVLPATSSARPLAVEAAPNPYPGLVSFTEKDAGFFFGRESEVEALWSRLPGRRLLAVIGPSGAGKTSFVRAGVIASRPSGWGTLLCTPGVSPLRSLGRALAPELAREPEALRQLLSFDEPDTAVELVGRWRRAHAEGLLVVDQFEEVFTLASREAREGFAALLGRLAREADVHVLLSLRDDFLIRCSEHEALAPVFESLTPLAGLGPRGLRRALVEPARREGYRFEDESLVDEMVRSVEGSRGALPLLAFALGRLWERRDHAEKLLTWQAFEEIGGVAGALAQHAEATLERIGGERQGIVRDLFRNLVTAQGTRAVADRDETLSVFPERSGAEHVVNQLVLARLLTTYEVEGTAGQRGRHRIEIVHESLLDAWPRLVRWRTQDEDSALLRDQLRQAARLWDERGRTADLLWTGTAYREFELWRERYPGALSAVEDGFARAMAARARRSRRLRRAAVASAFVVLAAVVIAIALSRQQAARARDAARAEALRAEAGKLLALGRADLDRHPTAALAYTRRSLELFDTPEARRFAVEVLWRGPVARILSPDRSIGGPERPEDPGWARPVFSPDARWLALLNGGTHRLLLYPEDGGKARTIESAPDARASVLGFGPRSDLLVAGGPGTSLRAFSLPDLKEIRRVELGGGDNRAWFAGDGVQTLTRVTPDDWYGSIRSWSLPDGEVRTRGTVAWRDVSNADVDPAGRSLAFASANTVRIRSLDGPPTAGRVLASHADAVVQLAFFPDGGGLASVDATGEIRLSPLGRKPDEPVRILHAPRAMDFLLAADRGGRHVARSGIAGSAHLWDLRDPPDAEPVVLKRSAVVYGTTGVFDPSGRWLVTSNDFDLAFWSVTGAWRRVLPGSGASTWGLAFTPDGRWLASCVVGELARLWPMDPAVGRAHPLAQPEPCWGVATDAASRHFLVTTYPSGSIWLHGVAGGPAVRLQTGWEGEAGAWAAAFDSQGRRAAACPESAQGFPDPRLRALRLWDLASTRGRSVSLAPFVSPSWTCEKLAFGPDGAVFVGGNDGVLRVVLPDDPKGVASVEHLHAAGRAGFDLSRDGRQLLVWAGRNPGAGVFEELRLYDLVTRASRRITTHGRRLWTAAFDPSGRIIVSGDIDGVVRAGPVTGEEPHLLAGHEAQVTALTVSPDGRWIASASDDALILWPTPDVARPPLHTLPHDQLLARLEALTNLRVVRDASSSTGWKLDVGPFPGWRDTPTW